MSFLAKLELEGESYTVLEFKISLYQATDVDGKPSSEPQGGIISLILESTNSVKFFNWMISNNQTKDGEIIFYRRDAISKMRDVKFKKAYCIGYNELFTSYNTSPMRVEVVISANSISMNGSEFKKNWSMIG